MSSLKLKINLKGLSMSEDEVFAERRSLVGAPPSRRGAGTPATKAPLRTPSARQSGRGKRKRGDSDDESEVDKQEAESEAGDPEDSEAESAHEQDGGKPKRKRKRGSKPLTDAISRKKRSEAKKAALQALREQEGYESPEEEKPATPIPEPEPEPVKKAPLLSKYTALQLMCDHLLRKLQSKDPEEYFAFPVTASMAPDYHSVIATPMDFSTMRQKIEDNLYKTIPEMRFDSELIVSNALAYNGPNTVYHLAGTRLTTLIRYYFSEQYLRFIFHTLPFANQVPLEVAGLTPLQHIPSNIENRRKMAVVDKMTAEDCMNAATEEMKPRLSARKPAKIGFIDNKDGATTLNIIGESEKKDIRLIDLVGPLEEGNPGMLTLGDHRLSSVTTINYLTSYGPFASFAPQYESTWASLTKSDSDLLLRTYGDKNNVADVISLRDMVADSGELMIKAVDNLLDSLTHGEHSRTMGTLENKSKIVDGTESVCELLDDIATLENLGIDVSFVSEVRQNLNAPKTQGLQAELNASGQAVLDLARLQHQRLSKPPPISLNKAALPSPLETQLAANLQQQLVTQVAAHAQPAQLISAPSIHNAIGMTPDEVDVDLLGEFFVMQD